MKSIEITIVGDINEEGDYVHREVIADLDAPYKKLEKEMRNSVIEWAVRRKDALLRQERERKEKERREKAERRREREKWAWERLGELADRESFTSPHEGETSAIAIALLSIRERLDHPAPRPCPHCKRMREPFGRCSVCGEEWA